ncbi:hypothetical protein F511_11422 [Dorcoceras hygrometricum]|uniref:Uncharacterized protein n=1 Tax=Dorcoceras hygrometricum TaxID=472368 RepID=A0A2Z7D412_9LAMI|nr:hypothetical protein F511_11422 [Dorcoceras hygrometricum]
MLPISRDKYEIILLFVQPQDPSSLLSQATPFHNCEDKSQNNRFRDQPPSRSVMHPRTMPLFTEQMEAQTWPRPSPASGLTAKKRQNILPSGRGLTCGMRCTTVGFLFLI